MPDEQRFNGPLGIAGGKGFSGSALYVARNRPQLRRLIGKVDFFFVDITPTPTFGRIVAFDDRMSCRVKMRGGMAVRRVIATTDVTALSAEAQMNPLASDLEAVLASARARCDFLDRRTMRTRGHAFSFIGWLANMA
jgi:hypothetical protein